VNDQLEQDDVDGVDRDRDRKLPSGQERLAPGLGKRETEKEDRHADTEDGMDAEDPDQPDPTDPVGVPVRPESPDHGRLRVEERGERGPLLEETVRAPEEQEGGPSLLPADVRLADEQYAGPVEPEVEAEEQEEDDRRDHHELQGRGTREVLRDPRREREQQEDRVAAEERHDGPGGRGRRRGGAHRRTIRTPE